MGQPITVSIRKGNDPEVRILDTDRSLTGMAIERYASVEAARSRGRRPPNVLAERILEAGAMHVTVYGNVITVRASDWSSLEERAQYLVTHLFEYYGEDAGWSPSALGVEATPPTEVAAL